MSRCSVKTTSLRRLLVGVEHQAAVVVIALQDAAQLVPLPVGAARAQLARLLFEALQDLDLDFQLFAAARGRRLVENLVFGLLDFVVGCFVEIVDVVVGQHRRLRRRNRTASASSSSSVRRFSSRSRRRLSDW